MAETNDGRSLKDGSANRPVVNTTINSDIRDIAAEDADGYRCQRDKHI